VFEGTMARRHTWYFVNSVLQTPVRSIIATRKGTIDRDAILMRSTRVQRAVIVEVEEAGQSRRESPAATMTSGCGGRTNARQFAATGPLYLRQVQQLGLLHRGTRILAIVNKIRITWSDSIKYAFHFKGG
jgi:hypothetical protein